MFDPARNGYLFYLSCTEPLKTHIRMAGGVQSLKFLPWHLPIGRELHREARRPYGGRLTGNKKIGRCLGLHPKKVGHPLGCFL